MTKRATYGVAIAAALSLIAMMVPADGSAQKYPERRTTRFGTRDYLRGDFAGAGQRYRRAQELDPGLREATFNLGDALWRQAQGAAQSMAPATQQGQEPTEEQKAVQALAQQAAEAWMGIAADSLAPAPLVSAANYNAGNAALMSQQIDAAIEAYKAALRLRPNDMEAKFNLAYAQKLKQQQQQQQNDDQNKDQNKDDGGGGGGGDQNDRQNDPNKDDSRGDRNRDDQNGDGQDDPEDGDGDKDDKNGDGNQNGDGQGDNDPKEGDGQGGGKPKMDPRAAEQMLDAMQAAEDGTREKVDAKKAQAASHSGKNW